MIKKEVKSNGTIDYILVIEPKGFGDFEYIFGEEHNFDDNEIGYVRFIYKEPFDYSRCFKHLDIGEHRLNYKKILDAYGGYSGVDNFPFKAKFKNGDKLKLSTDYEINRIELYFSKRTLMINRLINYSNPKPPIKES